MSFLASHPNFTISFLKMMHLHMIKITFQLFNSHTDGKALDFTALVRVVGKHFRHLL